MGLGKQAARDAITTLKAGTATRTELRAAIGEAIDALQTKAAAMDVQAAQAHADFAATKAGQFQTFVAALPDVGDPVP